MFKKAVSVLLSVSLLSWTVGCTSTKYVTVTDLGQAQGNKEIEVLTKEGPNYRLTEWTADPSGDITGRGTVYYQDGHSEPFSGTILADSIRAVKGKVVKIDAVNTTAIVVGVAAYAAVITMAILAINFSIP